MKNLNKKTLERHKSLFFVLIYIAAFGLSDILVIYFNMSNNIKIIYYIILLLIGYFSVIVCDNY